MCCRTHATGATRSELSESPAIFFGDLVDDGLLQFGWQNAPGIGLDLEVGAKVWMIAAVGEKITHVGVGGAQGWSRFGVEGDVKVNACFATGARPRRIEFGQIREA